MVINTDWQRVNCAFHPVNIIDFASFRRYGGLKIKNCQLVPTPVSLIALAPGDPVQILGWTGYLC